MYEKYIKRLLDFTLSLLAIIVLSPLLVILCIIGAVMMDGNPFFTQERVGKNEKIFKLLKFRSMSNKKDKNGNLLPDDMRLNKYGRLLRGTSLDELPELFNILLGQLSIVGPRPLLVAYLPYYTKEERHRHDVTPGLTVPEVVYGNVNPTWDEQFRYEIEYAKNVRFVKDVKIIFATIRILFKRVEEDYGSEIRKPLNIERGNQT